MTSTNTPNISIGGNKTKSKLLNLSINDISSVGDNRGKGKMRNLSGLEFLKENSINKTGIIENANNESVNMRNKAKKKLSLPNNGDSEIKNSLHSSFQPATKSTPKTTKLKQMKEINLNSTKDLYLTTLSQNQSSPTKGRNKTTLIKSVKSTTPNNRSSINSSINQSQSQMNSLSPFLTNTKSKSLIDRKSAIKATTHAYSTTLKGKNILNNLKKMNNITISNNNPFSTINIQEKKKKTDKKTISNLMNTSTNIKIKKSTQDQYTSSNNSKSPMSKTTIATNTNSNSNFYPAEKNGKNMVDIKSRSTYYNSKLKEFKCLINELLHCEDKKIVQEFNEYIKEAYHNLEGKETIFEKQKLDEVNNIFECIKKENKEPKEFIQIKTEDFDSLYGKIKTLNKESQIANKNNKAGITKLITNSGINSASISKSTHVSSSPINARTMKKSPFASVKNFYKNHSNSNKVLNSSLFGKNLNFNVNFSKKTAPENKEELLKISLDNKTNNVSPSTVDEGNIKEEDNINYQDDFSSNLSSIYNNSQISLEPQADFYYTTQKKENSNNILMKMPKLELNLNHDKDTSANTPLKSNVMKDNFIKDSGTGKNKDKECVSTKLESKNQLGLLKLECLPKSDFNDEFMQHAEDFSPSWREGCRKIHLLK